VCVQEKEKNHRLFEIVVQKDRHGDTRHDDGNNSCLILLFQGGGGEKNRVTSKEEKKQKLVFSSVDDVTSVSPHLPSLPFQMKTLNKQ